MSRWFDVDARSSVPCLVGLFVVIYTVLVGLSVVLATGAVYFLIFLERHFK